MMLDFQQKRKVRGFLYNRITIGVLLLILIVLLRSTWAVYQKKIESENFKEASLKNVESLRARSSDLQSKIDRLATKQGIEEEVRSKFSVAKDNENMVIIVPDNSTTTAEVAKTDFWSRLESFFGKK